MTGNQSAANGLSAVRASVAEIRERTVRSTAAPEAVAEILSRTMHATLFLVLVLGSVLLVGCGPSATKPSTPAEAGSVTNSWAFEGAYIDTNYNDRPTITFQAGRYTGALPANPGGDVNGAGRYSVQEVELGKWELDLKYDTGGSTTVVVRKVGNGIAIRDISYGGETILVKK